MGYDIEKWKKRIAERSDLSTQVINLTRESARGGNKQSALTNLKKIVSDRQINASSNEGFINGSTPAVCFQDAPLYAACQNTYFEQKYRRSNPSAKVRYSPIGLMFEKEYVYDKGGRPVFYEKPTIAKKLLPESEWWRIVNFDMSDKDNVIDWTHEREWRCPRNFEFEIENATLIFVKSSNYRGFMQWDSKQKHTVMDKVRGVVVLSDLLY